MVVLAAARLLRLLAGLLEEQQRLAALRELLAVGLQAVGTRQLQQLFPQLSRVSLQEQQQQMEAVTIDTRLDYKAFIHPTEGKSESFAAATAANIHYCHIFLLSYFY